jgi:hypothetical protein
LSALADCEARYAKRVPSTPQIAHIAAILANGNPIAMGKPLLVADYALMDTLRMDYLPKFHKENRRNRARAMAAGRWSKKAEKTS